MWSWVGHWIVCLTNFRFLFCEIKVRDPVEDSDTGVPSSITVKMEYFCFSILLLRTLCRKPMRGETESIVLLIFVLLWCLNSRWVRDGGMGQKVLFRTSWNRIFIEPGIQPKKQKWHILTCYIDWIFISFIFMNHCRLKAHSQVWDSFWQLEVQ